MRDIGIKVQPGSGAAAAEEYYRAHGEQMQLKAAE
jgi:hypothetical protein